MADVLFLCTGNLCRSPSAAMFLEQLVQLKGPQDMTIDSAGTMGAAGGTPSRLVKEGAAFGLDFTDHVPRHMDMEDIRTARLVIGMTRQHVREAILLDIPSFGKSFTLREFVRRGGGVGPRGAGIPLSEWLVKVHGARRHLDLVGQSAPDDIPDPMGGSSEDYRRMLIDVQELVRQLHTLIWPA
jgi:protein-tyrosine phosphatase